MWLNSVTDGTSLVSGITGSHSAGLCLNALRVPLICECTWWKMEYLKEYNFYLSMHLKCQGDPGADSAGGWGRGGGGTPFSSTKM